jgi:putative heme-binding domain-containing protein
VEGLQHYSAAEAAEALVAGLPKLDTATTDKALGVLVSRREGALKLLQAVDAGTVPAKRLALDVLTTARSLNDDAVNELLTKHYGNIRKSPEELQRRLKEVRDALDTAAGAGDKARGKLVYTENCAKCHVFFGEGRQVGPELTGVERSNRELLLQSIIDPSATVLPEFMASTFTLRDGDPGDPFSAERQVTGFLLEETPQSVTLIDSAGNEITVPPAAITQREAMELSLMPTGLLDATTPQQIRDLFAYLMASGPVN